MPVTQPHAFGRPIHAAGAEAPPAAGRLPNSFRQGPDSRGRYGQFGGRFVSETLMPLILEVERAYEAARHDPEFLTELPGGEEHKAMWDGLRENHNAHSHGWRSAGLCEGQGSQSYSEVVGVCLGSNCCPFKRGSEARCTPSSCSPPRG